MDPDYALSLFYTSDPYYSDTDIHSGFERHDNQCCPLVVDFLCLAAILGAIAGATVLVARASQIELCSIDGVNIRPDGPDGDQLPCPEVTVVPRRRKRHAELLEGKVGSKNLCLGIGPLIVET